MFSIAAFISLGFAFAALLLKNILIFPCALSFNRISHLTWSKIKKETKSALGNYALLNISLVVSITAALVSFDIIFFID